MRRIKKLPFEVPNCITRFNGDTWYDSKTGDKIHTSKLKSHIDTHYSVPAVIVVNGSDFPNEKGNRRFVKLPDVPEDALPDEDLRDEIIRSRRYDLRD